MVPLGSSAVPSEEREFQYFGTYFRTSVTEFLALGHFSPAYCAPQGTLFTVIYTVELFTGCINNLHMYSLVTVRLVYIYILNVYTA